MRMPVGVAAALKPQPRLKRFHSRVAAPTGAARMLTIRPRSLTPMLPPSMMSASAVMRRSATTSAVVPTSAPLRRIEPKRVAVSTS